MDILKLIPISLLACFAAMLTKKFNSECGQLISVISGVSVCVFSVAILSPVAQYVTFLTESNDYSPLTSVLIKSAGICLLCTSACEICKDLGESSLASKLELAGKCTLITMSLPVIKTVFDYAQKLIN